jgi:hypothetical protein
MRPRLLTLGTQVVTLAPRVALHVAGTAWEAGQSVLTRVLKTTPPTAARLAGAAPAAPPPVRPPTMPAPEVTVTEPAPSHDELPLEDFDHLTVGSLRSRIRSLDVEDVRRLHAYEVEHANRLPVVAVLSNRIATLEKDLAGSPT